MHQKQLRKEREAVPEVELPSKLEDEEKEAENKLAGATEPVRSSATIL